MNPSGDMIEKRTCTQCRKSKVKCDKSNPCARCIRLGLNCVEQVRGRGRPLVSYMLRPADGMLENHHHVHHHEHQFREGELRGSVVSDYPASIPYMGVGGGHHWNLSLAHPETAQPVIQDFFRDEGRLKLINRRKLLIVLRSWGLTARSKKTQAFFKTVQSVASTFHLELKDILNMEPEVYRELCGGEERKTWAFNPLELPIYVNALDCEASAVSKRIVIDGESRYYNNEMFSSLFHTSEDADRMFERSTGYDVWLSCIDNEDRKEFYEACLSSMLLQSSMSSETNKVFKCKDKNGRTFLAVTRMRSMFFSAGDYVGYSFSITPIPNSKYFSPGIGAINQPPGVTTAAPLAGAPEPSSSAARLRAFVDIKAPLTLASTHHQPPPPRSSVLEPPAIPPQQQPMPTPFSYSAYHPQAPSPPPDHHHHLHHHRQFPPMGSKNDEIRWGMGASMSGSSPPTSVVSPPLSMMGPGGLALGGSAPSHSHQSAGGVGSKRPRSESEELEAAAAEAERERTIAATLQRMCLPQGLPGGERGSGLGMSPTHQHGAGSPPVGPSVGGVTTSTYPGSLSILGGAASQVSSNSGGSNAVGNTGGGNGTGHPQPASTLAQYLRSSATSAMGTVGGGGGVPSSGAQQQQGQMHSPSSRSSERDSDFLNSGRASSPAKVITQI